MLTKRFPLSTLFILTIGTISLAAEVTFKRVIIDPAFKAEACAAADINRDGKLDIIAGENWYEAPDWKPHRFRELDTNIDNSGYADVRADWPVDLNGDGWVDLATVRRASKLQWLEHPGDTAQPGTLWKIHEAGDSSVTEGVIFGDVLNDNRPEFISPSGKDGQGVSCWSATTDPNDRWIATPIGNHGGGEHGLGVGDINRDGHPDILTTHGWFRSPGRSVATSWQGFDMDRPGTHHPVVYDFDSDGDQDIAASSPHDYGLWWWAQNTDPQGRTTWKRTLIDKTISQLHDLVSVDMDGDGDMDLLTGKRYYAHQGRDPGADEPAMLVWYELQREKNAVKFVRHVIDEDSGLGYVVTPADIDGDGDMDVVTANKKGVFLFVQQGEPIWAPLFNGKNLDNWKGDKQLWTVENNTIVGQTATGLKHNDFLISAEEYSDFVLTLDVKLEPDSANSGIQFRSQPAEHGEVKGYQADIGEHWWGSIYEELGRALLNNGYKPLGKMAVVPEQWNRYVVYAVGDTMRVEINGTVCTELKDNESSRGIIALQIHSGGPTRIAFRNIKMRLVTPPR